MRAVLAGHGGVLWYGFVVPVMVEQVAFLQSQRRHDAIDRAAREAVEQGFRLVAVTLVRDAQTWVVVLVCGALAYRLRVGAPVDAAVPRFQRVYDRLIRCSHMVP